MKTLANCNSIEFLTQVYKVSEILKNYVDGVKEAKKHFEEGEKDAFKLISSLPSCCLQCRVASSPGHH